MSYAIYAESKLPTPHGRFRLRAYRDETGTECLAVATPFIDTSKPVNVRIHSSCITGEVFGSCRCDCQAQLNWALEYIAGNTGMIIYLLQEGRGIGIGNKVRAYAMQDYGYDTAEANEVIGMPIDQRDYEAAVDVLRDQRVSAINLITNNPEKIEYVEAAGLTVADRIAADIAAADESSHYLATKREKFGHLL